MGFLAFRKQPSLPLPAPNPPPETGSSENDLRELTRHLDEDLGLITGALKALQPGMSPEALAGSLHRICFRPLGLASFFLALADWERDMLAFPYYHEGGRERKHTPRSLSKSPGLTGMTLQRCESLYVRTLLEGKESGTILSDAEADTGLVPQTWFGVPLGVDPAWGPRPFGVLSFQSFQPDAFSESRRALMECLSGVLAFALKADPALPLPGGKS
ncbi:MAG: GAF domain-containing protein [Acidobacteria bacterium]|nr:GAF domain-containing protein [Acidobacteriota bacterium]